MTDHKMLYTMLFNSITDAIKLLDKLDTISAKELLITSQQKAEELFIEDEA